MPEANSRSVDSSDSHPASATTKSATISSQRPVHLALGPDGTPRVVIRITTDEHHVNEEAIGALGMHPEVFQRGGKLVRRVRHLRPKEQIRRTPGSPYIETIPQARLRELLTEVAEWKKYSKQEQNWVPAHPPPWAVKGIYARRRWDGIRPLEAIVETPVLRPDGTILSAPGYDEETGLFFEPNLVDFAFSESPTREDALAASTMLLDSIGDFPFQAPLHQSAWLAALLTPLARFSLNGEPVPLMLIDANVRGSGKSRLCDVISIVTTGRTMPRMAYAHDDCETRKRITSIALAGDSQVLFDNIAGELGCPALDAALTAPTWEDRRLGVNETVSIPLTTTFFATGNNVMLVGDTSRRTLHVRLDSPLEHPEERTDFKHPDLLAWIRDQRATLLGAALAILRAYFLAACPDMKLVPWGSFEAWSRVIRGAIVWIGLPDPAETREELRRTADAEATEIASLLSTLDKLDAKKTGFTAAELTERMETDPVFNSALIGILRDVCALQIGARIDSRVLGNLFRKVHRRNFGGRKLERLGLNRDGVVIWRVQRLESSAAIKSGAGIDGAGSAGPAGSVDSHKQFASPICDEGMTK